MGLFDGRSGRRARLDRARRRAARRAGDAGGRRRGAVAQRRRAAARVLVVRPRDAGRRGDPQPGRLERHEAVLRARLRRGGLPVLGALPRRAELAVPSRHLGLVTGGRARRRGHGGGRGDGRAGGGARRPRRGGPPGPADPAGPGLGPGGELSRPRPRPCATPTSRAAVAPRRTERGFVRRAGRGRWWRSRGAGVHLRLRRAHRTAGRRRARGRRRSTRCTTSALPAGTVAAGARPAASPRSTSPRCRRTPRCARRRRPRRVRRAGARRVRRAALPLRGRSTAQPMCGVLPATAAHDRPAHPRLPRGGGAHRLRAVRGRASGWRGTSSTARGDPPGRGRRRPGGGAAPSREGFVTGGGARVVPAHPPGRRPGSRRALRPRRRTINPADRPGVSSPPQPPVAAARSARLTGS